MTGPVRISIQADGRTARREFVQTASAADRMGDRIGRGFAVARRGAAVGALGLTAAAISIGKSAVQTEAEFSQRMSMIGAATGAGTKKLEQLRDLAKDMGAQTSFSANEAADAMLELSKSGLTPATIQAGALEGTLTLAAAGGTDLATAATVASNALNTFKLRGKDMASVAAALAGGANASSASVESLAFGLSQVGPGAINAGLSLQDTVGVLSAFDAAGIKGSDAGTSLKTMLTRLVPQTDKASDAMRDLGLDFTNADGSFLSITQVAQQLQDRLGGLSAEQRTTALATIFGSDATRAATVLMDQGAKGVRKYIRATKDQSAAQEAAEARMAGTKGALERLSGAAETSKLIIGEALAPVIVDVADYLSENLVPATEKAVDFFEKLVGASRDLASGDGTKPLSDFGDALGDVDWPRAIDGAKEVASAITEITGAVGEVGLDALADGLNVTGEVLGFVADNSDKLGAALPFLAAGFVGIKVAQAAANLAMAAAIPLRLAELAASRQQTVAIRAMTAAVAQLTAAQRVNAVSTGAMIHTQAGSYSAIRQTATAATAATGSITRMGAAARGAAGAGGMLGLSLAASSSSRSVQVLGSTASGALLGFSLGGPIGAAIGAGAGALVGFSQSTKLATEEQEKLATAQQRVVDTLNAQTGAYTERTRQALVDDLANSGLLKQASDLGLNLEQMTTAVLSGSAAIDDFRTAVAGKIPFEQLTNFHERLIPELRDLSTLYGSGAKGFLLNAQAMGTADTKAAALRVRVRELAEQVSILPRQARVLIEARNADKSARQVRQLIGAMNLAPKQVTTLVRLLGVDKASSGAKRVREDVERVGRAKPDLRPFVRGLESALGDGKRATSRGATDLVRLLAGGTRKAKADLSGVAPSVTRGVGPAKGAASVGGTQIGNALEEGIISGFASTQARLSSNAAAAVSAAIAAARARAKINSPSKETEYIGRMMGEGLNLGLERAKPGAKKKGRSLVAAALASIGGGSDGISTAVDRITRLVEKQVKLKDDKAEGKRERAILKGLRNELTALKANGKEQDRNNARLERARDRYKQLADDARQYAASIKDSFVGYGSVVGLGEIEDGSVSTANLLDQLKDRLARSERFAELIRSLSGKLNATSLQQLIDAGVDGGLATAEAITAGGASALTQINTLTAQIGAAGAGLGDAMRDKFKQAGVDAAAGLVAGLEREQKALDRAADRIGQQIARALKKALGIKSPSKVFRGIGEDTMAGLAIGLDETYARTLGARVGRGVQQGFTRPTLDTTVTSPPAASSQSPRLGTIRIEITAEAVNQLRAGKKATIDVDTARLAGVRTLAIGGR